MKERQLISIAAIILAGGKSTRMGQDKALLTINDFPLLTHVCKEVGNVLNLVYVVAPWIDKYREIVPESVRLIEEKIVIPDAESNCPLIGFYQGLQKIDAEWVLLLACDLPNVDSLAIQQWCQYLPEIADREIALLPYSEKGYEPLCGFYRRSCLPLLKNYIDRGGKSFQKWLSQHPVKELSLSDRSILFNCNTWNDWLKLNSS